MDKYYKKFCTKGIKIANFLGCKIRQQKVEDTKSEIRG